MPFQPKSTRGKSSEGQLFFLTRLQHRAESVGVQMKFARGVAADTQTKLITFMYFDQTQLLDKQTICNGQVKRCSQRCMSALKFLCGCMRNPLKQAQGYAPGQSKFLEPQRHGCESVAYLAAAFQSAIFRAGPVSSKMCMPVLARSTM